MPFRVSGFGFGDYKGEDLPVGLEPRVGEDGAEIGAYTLV